MADRLDREGLSCAWSRQSSDLPRPSLDVGPLPDTAASELGLGLGEHGIGLHELVNTLARQPEHLGDLGDADEMVHTAHGT